MKKFLYYVLAIWLALSLAACSMPAATTPSLPSATAVPKVVTFADPVLEAMVRGSIGKLTGDITVAEAESVTRLNISNEWQRYISEETTIHDIDGLEYFKNLESLDLSFHAISNITPLSGLKKLTSLSLGGSPSNDIAPLAGLTGLKVLILTGCKAQDYAPLAKLVNLDFLMLDHCDDRRRVAASLAHKTQVSVPYRQPHKQLFPNVGYLPKLRAKGFHHCIYACRAWVYYEQRQQSGELWGRSARRVEREHQPRRVGRSAV